MVVVKSVMKTVVFGLSHISAGNEAWDDYLKCSADLYFEVDFVVNGTIGAVVTKWDLILFG